MPEKLKMSLDVDGTGIGLYLLANLGIGSFEAFTVVQLRYFYGVALHHCMIGAQHG